MQFADFLELPERVLRVRDAIVGGRATHAYLFVGLDGTGKRSFAEVCARALHCTGARKPCDECPNCRMFLSDDHPDHHTLKPERTIGIDAVRDLVGRLATKPFASERHTVVIEQADKMTVQAQNALLKTLETPPGAAVFFLLAESPGQLLSTIQSRAALVRFSPLSLAAEARALEERGVAGERAEILAKYSQGALGQALELSADEAFWALRERTLRALDTLKSLSSVGPAAQTLANDADGAERVLSILEQWAREYMLAEGPPGLRAQRILRGAMRTRRLLASNVRWQSALEMLLLDIAATGG